MRLSSFVVTLLSSVLVSMASLEASKTTRGNITGAEEYGAHITVLPNGYVVVVDPKHDVGSVVNAGAVHLYDQHGGYISRFVGAQANDQIGSGGVVVLTSGNFVVLSPLWDNGTTTDAGAVSFCTATGGLAAGVDVPVTASNSLVGSAAGDSVGSGGVKALTNGHYVVLSPLWVNGSAAGAGAATWGSGTTGRTGGVSSANSLVGSRAGDGVGSFITALTNGHYVVSFPSRDTSTLANVGAATWGSGTSGATGTLSSSNSLVGSSAEDAVGAAVTALTNGHYVVSSRNWKNSSATGAGAVTWGSGTVGVKGSVSSTNSLVGTQTDDHVGDAVTPLTNGHYVVSSPSWDRSSTSDAGAVTWGDGTEGVAGSISSSNSLVGSTTGDMLDGALITPLTNGHYVVRNQSWDNASSADVGAVTWGSGTAGVKGSISSSNSLIGPVSSGYAGSDGVKALTNGNYVVNSPYAISGGAVTWGSGTAGVKGVISDTNSLVRGASSTAGSIGAHIIALTNGNYVVNSPRYSEWSFCAVTWGSGAAGVKGEVSASNSVIISNSFLEGSLVVALTNGNYVIDKPNSGGLMASGGAGVARWMDGTAGTSGMFDYDNTFRNIGAAQFQGSVMALSNGSYVAIGPRWTSPGSPVSLPVTGPIDLMVAGGAVTWWRGLENTIGAVSELNSLTGGRRSDSVGSGGVLPLSNGDYAVKSPSYASNPAMLGTGAVTLGNGTTGTVGKIFSGTTGHVFHRDTSVEGETAGGGASMVTLGHPQGKWVVVGRPADRKITFLSFLQPELVVEQPAGTPLMSGSSTVDFGSVPVGQSITRTFVVRNDGEFTLSDLVPLRDGAQAADFTLGALDSTIYAPGVGDTLTVTFTPGAAGARKAELKLPSNEPGTSPFTITLKATGLTAEGLTLSQAWRQQHFGNVSNSGDGADTATPKQDGVTNLMKYATGMDPTVAGSMPGVVSASSDGTTLSFVYNRADAAVAEGILFTVEWSDTLAAGEWSTVGVTESAVNQGATDVVTATVPAGSGGSRFVRLRVERP